MTANLRTLFLSPGKTLVAPGAADALSARLIEAHGYQCVYIGSYATAASRFGITDTGLLSLESLVAQARTIAQAIRVPVIADAEGGFEHAFSITRQFAALQRALADGKLASDTQPLEDFLGYTDARGAG